MSSGSTARQRSDKQQSYSWRLRVEIPLPVTPQGASMLGPRRITFRLAGKGTAWVDDFIFAEQDPGRPPICDPNAPPKH